MVTQYNAPINYNEPGLGYNGLPSIVTASELPTYALRVTDAAGNVSPLPEAIVEQMSFEASQPNSIAFSVPKGTVGYEQCGYYSIVELILNGQPVRDGKWLLRTAGWNEGVMARVNKFNGRGLLWDRLDYTVVWNDRRYVYSARTPGYILNDLFATAELRGVGYWDEFTWNFTATHDSFGNAWPTPVNLEFLPTAKYKDIVENLVDKGLIDIYLLGNEIVMAVAGKDGDVAPVGPLVVGTDVTEAPQLGTVEGIVSDVLVVGDEGVTVRRENTETRATYWREEVGISQGGTKDIGTLSIFGDVALNNGESERVQRSYGLVITQYRPILPLRDYTVGNWVNISHGSGGSSQMVLRVKQIVLKQNKGHWTGTLVLNDKFLEADLRLAKKVDGILGGATITGNSQTAPSPEQRDTGVPNAPSGVIATVTPYQDDAGKTQGVLSVDWNDVTTNTDGSAMTDLKYYVLVWKYVDEPISARRSIPAEQGSQIAISPVEVNRAIVLYVYTSDQAGNTSAASSFVTVTGTGDTVAPPTPMAPLGTSAFRMLVIEGRGLTAGGVAMPADLSHFEVWTSTINNFDQISGTIHGSIPKGFGQFYVPSYGYAVGTTVYAKFVAVDYSGNRSAMGGQVTMVSAGVQGPDLVANSVTANTIAAGAISSVHILAGAISADKISLGPTMNLVQDPSFNTADWRAQRLTTKWSDRPEKWFFNNWSGRARNGYYLQALSTPAGENGGRMYLTDWIGCQYGEAYYVGMFMRTGEFAPSATARMIIGVEVTRASGEIVSDTVEYTPTGTWTKYGFTMPIGDMTWVKIRFFVRADNLNAGDIIMDDWEVRSAVGTTAYSGPRLTILPEGLFMYDALDNQTVWMDARTGDVSVRGSVVSGYLGKRVEVNPGSTYLPEIRFYPQDSEEYAYINAVGTTTVPYLGLNGADYGSGPKKGNALILSQDGFQLGEINKDTGASFGPGISTSIGTGGYMWIEGRMVANPGNGKAMFYGSAWTIAAGTGSVILTKPATPAAGSYHPIYSVHRNTATFFRHHIQANSAASWQCTFEVLAGFQTRVHELVYRGDG